MRARRPDSKLSHYRHSSWTPVAGGVVFVHPAGYPSTDAQKRAYAENFIRKKLGEEHVADLDWENSVVLDD